MRFGAFIITYNRPIGLRKVLNGLLEQTHPPDFILVVDNGKAVITQSILQDFTEGNVLHHVMENNLGPAGAAAYGIQWLAQNGFDWIGWADDNDPPPVRNTFERLLKIAETVDTQEVAAIGAVGAHWDWKRGEFARLPDQALHGILDVDTLGGGHQFIQSKEVINRVGLPDTRLFFGFFDPEYCLRIRRAGYRLLVDGDLMLQYRTLAGRLQVKQKRAIVSRYPLDSLWQQYYRTRNYIYMMNHTFNRPDLASREVRKALGRVLGAWLRGPRYGFTYTQLQWQGILDGYKSRLGYTITPTAREGKLPL